MKIIVDAMGGDNAPREIVKGALRARDELDLDLILVGRKEEVEACLQGDTKRVEIVDAREVVTMEDDPSTATRRKKNSSMMARVMRSFPPAVPARSSPARRSRSSVSAAFAARRSHLFCLPANTASC